MDLQPLMPVCDICTRLTYSIDIDLDSMYLNLDNFMDIRGSVKIPTREEK